MGDTPTEEEFKAAGITHVFLRSTACAATGKHPVTDLSAVEADITTLGAVTGTRAKAAELVAGMNRETRRRPARPSAARRPAPGRRTSSSTTTPVPSSPWPSATARIAHAVITLAGARNVFADCDGRLPAGRLGRT